MDRIEPSPRLETEDYYFEGELMVFTAAYHLKSDCRHCPYGFRGQTAGNSESNCTEQNS